MAFLWKCNIWRQTIVSRDKGIRGSFSLDQLFHFSTYLTKNIARIVNFVGVAYFLLDFNLESWFEVDDYNLSRINNTVTRIQAVSIFACHLYCPCRFCCCYCFLCCRRFHCRCSYYCFKVWFSVALKSWRKNLPALLLPVFAHCRWLQNIAWLFLGTGDGRRGFRWKHWKHQKPFQQSFL